MTAVQSTITPQKNPGLNGMFAFLFVISFCVPISSNYPADSLSGSGSVQATVNSVDVGKDAPFWNAVKRNLQNLVAVVSGHDHGNEWCAREPTKDIIFCFNKHSG